MDTEHDAAKAIIDYLANDDILVEEGWHISAVIENIANILYDIYYPAEDEWDEDEDDLDLDDDFTDWGYDAI